MRKFKLEKLMTGSKDGFSIGSFDYKCSKKGPTLTII